MDFEQLAAGRRTVHNYTPEKVEDELVVEALRLSLWAPNHKLTFPWVYTIVGAKARERIADIYVESKLGKAAEPVSEVKKRAMRDTLMNPSHFISIGIRRSEAKREHEDFATLACSVQIASLFLWENGIASKWTTSGFATDARVYEILGLDPAAVRLEGALFVGKAQITPVASERPRLDSVLRRVE
jgi:nitroreductase